jgi:hypothetical protein
MAQIIIDEEAAPSTPATGKVAFYAKIDGRFYSKDDAGTESGLGDVFTTATQTLTNRTLTTPQINDTSSDHQYIIAVSELAADRIITFPLLTTGDEFVFKDHAVTLTNKTLTTPTLNGPLLNNSAMSGIKTATFNSQASLSTTTGAVTIDWTAAQNYKQNEPTGTITYTFTAPPGPCHIQLLIWSDGTSTAQTINKARIRCNYGR